MSSLRFRRAVVPLLLVVGVIATACGGGAPDEVSSAGDPSTSPGSSVPDTTGAGPAAEATTTTTDGDVGATTAPPQTAEPAPTTTTLPEPDGGAPSPVAGLTAAELRAAVEAPSSATTRAATGPTAERVSLGDGRTVWRVRIPGEVPVRAARVEVLVGGRSIGEGIVAPDLSSLSVVTVDGAGLVAGAPVATRWEGATAEPAGTLVVAR
jgi:hypothetical protein